MQDSSMTMNRSIVPVMNTHEESPSSQEPDPALSSQPAVNEPVAWHFVSRSVKL
jgi:hypothetical protein